MTEAELSWLNLGSADHYGIEAQSLQTIEECSELIQALSKYRRVNGFGQPTPMESSTALKNLVEEIADVEIMLEQMKYLLNIMPEDSKAVKEFKVQRTRERMKGDH